MLKNESGKHGSAHVKTLSPVASVIHPVRFWDPGNPGDKRRWVNTPIRIGGRKGEMREMVLDFGKEVGGRIFVSWGRVRGAGAVKFYFSESLEYLHPRGDRVWGPQIASEVLGEHTYRGLGNTGWKDPLICGGFRYVPIKPDPRCAVEIRGIELEADFFIPENGEYPGSFNSSDGELNRIWQAAAYTMQVGTKRPDEGFFTTREKVGRGDWVVMDGAKRDRAVWGLDLSVIIPSYLLSIGEKKIVRDSLLSLLRQKKKGLFALRRGYIPHSSFPAEHPLGVDNSLKTFSNYVLWWIRGVYFYYIYTGDREFVEAVFEDIAEALIWFDKNTKPSPESNTPLFHANGFNDLSWDYTIRRRGFSGATNLLWAKTLEETATLARVAGHSKKAAQYSIMAAGIRTAVFERGFFPHDMYHQREGKFRHTTFDDPHTTLEVNAMAVLYDFISGAAADSLLDLLAERLHVEWGSLSSDLKIKGAFPDWHNMKVIPMLVSLEVEALMKRSRFEEAIALTKSTWMPMLKKGSKTTFWEWYGDGGRITNAFASLCHPWSAPVLQTLTEGLTGIRPETPGYKTFTIDPQFAANEACPSELEFEIPTPSGKISGAWKRKNGETVYEIECPEDVEGKIVRRPKMISVSGPGGKTINERFDGSQAIVFSRSLTYESDKNP